MSRQEKLVIIFLLICAVIGLAVSFYQKAQVPEITVSESEISKESGAFSFTKKLININSANEDELANLPGIGPAIAKNIITYRQENGLFSFPDELTKVKGIGKAKYERIKDLITTQR